jgi:hypothetical protein
VSNRTANPPLGGELLVGFLGQAPLIVHRQDLAGHSGGGLYHQRSDLALQLGQLARVIRRRRLARFGDDLLGGCDRTLGFLFEHARRCGSGLFD